MWLNFKSGINESIVRDLSKQKNEPEWMLQKRLKGLELYQNLEEPKFRYGIGITTKMDSLEVNHNPRNDGNFLAKDNEIVIEDINKAIIKHESLIKDNFMTKCIDPREGKYIALHSSLWSQGTLILIPKGVKKEKSVNINIKNSSNIQFNNILIIAEEETSSTIVIKKTSENKSIFSSDIIEVITKPNSTLNIINIQDLNEESTNYSNTKIILDKNVKVNFMDFGLGSKISKSKITTILNGEEAKSKTYSLYYGSNNQNFDIDTSTIHKFPYTNCDIVSTNILDKKSKLIFNGLIRIEEGAHNSVGHQKEDSLLLSQDAEVCTIPNLELNNYDVKCSHGATITNIDDEKIFYLMSRGLTEEQAKESIIKGFFNKFLDIIDDPKIVKIISEAILTKSRYESLN